MCVIDSHLCVMRNTDELVSSSMLMSCQLHGVTSRQEWVSERMNGLVISDVVLLKFEQVSTFGVVNE